ncbi:MAG TPA: hypothetical protein VMR76_01415 [Candidatus Saccharimonadia bacterium]|nr:hypothetical protein [Candidatus Saccharimonadia bacterium]
MTKPTQYSKGGNNFKMAMNQKDSVDLIYGCGNCYSVVEGNDDFCWCCGTNLEEIKYGADDE